MTKARRALVAVGAIALSLGIVGHSGQAVAGNEAQRTLAATTPATVFGTKMVTVTATPTVSPTLPERLLLTLTAMGRPSSSTTPSPTATFLALPLPELNGTATAEAEQFVYAQTELAAAEAALAGRTVALVGCPTTTAGEFDVRAEGSAENAVKALGIVVRRYDGPDEVASLRAALASGMGGLIACNDAPLLVPGLPEALAAPLRQGVPVIVFGSGSVPAGVMSVAQSDFEVGAAAGAFSAQGVITLNRVSDGAIVLSGKGSTWAEGRQNGVKRAFTDNGLSASSVFWYAAAVDEWAAVATAAVKAHPKASVVLCLTEACEMPAFAAVRNSGAAATSMWVVGVGGDASVRNALREGKWLAGYVDRLPLDTGLMAVRALIRRMALGKGLPATIHLYAGNVVTLGSIPGDPQVLEPTQTPFPLVTPVLTLAATAAR